MLYVLDEHHNLIEAYDKEGVLAVLSQAIADGSLSGITADSAFVSKLKCCVGGGTHPVAFITQAKYNELKSSDSLVDNCLCIITDDTTAEDIDAMLKTLTDTVNGFLEGTQAVQKASKVVGDVGRYYKLTITADGTETSLDTSFFEKGKLYAVEIVRISSGSVDTRHSCLFWFITFGSYYNRINCGNIMIDLSENHGARILDPTGGVLSDGSSAIVQFAEIGDLWNVIEANA